MRLFTEPSEGTNLMSREVNTVNCQYLAPDCGHGFVVVGAGAGQVKQGEVHQEIGAHLETLSESLQSTWQRDLALTLV